MKNDLKKEVFIKENLLTTKDMVKEFIITKMETNTLGIGLITNFMVKEFIYLPKEIDMMES